MQKVCVISCAALSHPPLNTSFDDYASEDDREIMKVKAAAVLQAAVDAKCDVVVLSAFGCGAFGNPPHIVAAIFHEAIQFSPIKMGLFCILDDHNACRRHNPRGNFELFKEILGEFHNLTEVVGVGAGYHDERVWGEWSGADHAQSSWSGGGWSDRGWTSHGLGHDSWSR